MKREGCVCRMVLHIYDELVFEVPEDQVNVIAVCLFFLVLSFTFFIVIRG